MDAAGDFEPHLCAVRDIVRAMARCGWSPGVRWYQHISVLFSLKGCVDNVPV